MIVRTWHGCVPQLYATHFAAHLQRTGVEHARGVAGNVGAFVRQEIQGDWAHFFLATYWESMAAIQQFAGENYEVAVAYPDDEQFGLISDPYVFHHAVTDMPSTL